MSLLSLPGLIDPHVHLRDPGQTHKEDFYTGTSAALAGGYTCILDMPNNKTPITTLERLNEKVEIAKEKIVCDVGFYFGSVGDNLDEFEKVKNKVIGIKLYLNETTGNLKIADLNLLEKIFTAWSSSKIISSQSMPLHSGILLTKKSKPLKSKLPILVHAEDKDVEDVISVVRKIRIQTHFCHISTSFDLKQVIKAKEDNLPISCGVTPHHLFLTDSDAKTLGPFGMMKPPLRPKKDVEFLWKNINLIDIIESDHAPHTIEEKRGGAPTYGVPGLETTLPLLLTAVSQKRLTIEDTIRLCFKNPAKIFGIKTDSKTKIEIDPNWKFAIGPSADGLKFHTKCGWSPFDGWKVKGKVVRVFIRGKKVFEDGKVLVKPGFGKILLPDRK